MRRRVFQFKGVWLAGCLLSALIIVPLAAQQPKAAPKTAAPAKAGWTAKTVDGQPDLQGIWANNVITPLQRPVELKGRAHLTPEEMAALKSRVAELFSGDGDAAFADGVFIAAIRNVKTYKSADGATGDYNHFWLAERTFDDRTSLVIDPEDGRVPPFTPDAEKRIAASGAYRRNHQADGPEDLNMSTRCISFGLPNVLAGYNANVEIVQGKDYVVLYHEMIHDARVIPLDNRPHIPSNIRHRLGDSRAHWEGNTLVIDTTNFTPNAFSGPGSGRAGETTEQLHVTERLTRVSEDTLQYQFTMEDPGTWTRPWTAMIPWKKSNEKIYEYACHEGNVGLYGILSGARAEEAAGKPKAAR
jgi:hypothetical protein